MFGFVISSLSFVITNRTTFLICSFVSILPADTLLRELGVLINHLDNQMSVGYLLGVITFAIKNQPRVAWSNQRDGQIFAEIDFLINIDLKRHHLIIFFFFPFIFFVPKNQNKWKEGMGKMTSKVFSTSSDTTKLCVAGLRLISLFTASNNPQK